MKKILAKLIKPSTNDDDVLTTRTIGGSKRAVWAAPAARGDDQGADARLGLNLTKLGIVVAKGSAGAWDSDIVESPSVMYDPKSGRWVMAYVGYGTTSGAQRAAIGLATSTDGRTWTKVGTSPILAYTGTAADPDQNGCTGPVLFWDDTNGQYVLYYIGLTGTGYEAGTKSICYATASSLTGTWTRHGAVVSSSSAGTGWRSSAVWHVSIVERAGSWYMFFNATGSDGKEKIGYATAPALTGPWTCDDTNSPLLSGTGSGWEAGNVGDPSVRRVGDMWVMDYYGTNSGTTAACDGIAVTPDHDFPLGWQRYPNNPVLSPTAGSCDALFAHKPFVIYKGAELLHFYTAVDGSSVRQIALAVETPPSSAPAATLVVQDENGTIATGVTQIDFQGAGVTATPGTGEVIVTIPGATTSSGGAGELLMQDGVTGPPVPLENEARSDWLYQG